MIPAAITLGTLALVGIAVLLDRLPSPPIDCSCPRCDAGGTCSPITSSTTSTKEKP